MFAACASTVADQISTQAARWRTMVEGTAGACAWSSSDRFMAAIGLSEDSRAIHSDGRVIVGRARLEPWLETAVDEASAGSLPNASPLDRRSDLTHIAEACRHDGFPSHGGASNGVSRRHRLTQLTGAFGVVIWDPAIRSLLAVRDPLGLAPLYYSTHGDRIYLSDRPDLFPERTTFDLDAVAEFIGTGGAADRGTIWSGVRPVPAGCVLSWADGRVRCERYWSAAAIRQDETIDAEQAGREFGRLFRGAVLASLEPGQGA